MRIFLLALLATLLSPMSQAQPASSEDTNPANFTFIYEIPPGAQTRHKLENLALVNPDSSIEIEFLKHHEQVGIQVGAWMSAGGKQRPVDVTPYKEGFSTTGQSLPTGIFDLSVVKRGFDSKIFIRVANPKTQEELLFIARTGPAHAKALSPP